MPRIVHITCLLGLVLFASASAHAGMIRFSGSVTGFEDLSGNAIAAPVSPFAIGDTFQGLLSVVDRALAPGASFGNADILDYRFSVGCTSLTNAQTSIGGTLNADGTGLADFLAFTGVSPLGPNCSLCSAEIDENGFSVQNFLAGGRIVGELTASIGTPSADVPAPGGLLSLLSLAMIGGLSWIRRPRMR
ncbi:hypothetical protein [Salinisphaera sp. T31B1]|uniref:hypothetical protein n=1 Tax=Salinisphaera sp. T31B1 TaxID=727963 RepID=UPI00334012B2